MFDMSFLFHFMAAMGCLIAPIMTYSDGRLRLCGVVSSKSVSPSVDLLPGLILLLRVDFGQIDSHTFLGLQMNHFHYSTLVVQYSLPYM